MVTRSAFVLCATLLFNACAAAPPADAEVERLAKVSIKSQKTGIYNIHHVRMKRKLVPVPAE